MNIKRALILLLLGITLFVFTFSGSQPLVAQENGEPNLLQNPGFEGGHYNQDNLAEIAVPNGWRMHWLDNVTFPGAWDGLVAYRPETVVWNSGGAPENEIDLFWRDGIFTLKIFKSWAPMYAALSQDVSGLQPGRRYRLVAPVYIDIFEDYEGGQKVAPSRLESGQVRLGASPVGAAWRDESQINYTGWWNGGTISPFYQAYPVFIHEFTATQADMTVWIEVAGTYPHPNNGFFIDTVGLYPLDATGPIGAPASGGGGAAPVQQGPTPTPLPTPTPRADGAVIHTVQAGESFWGIAIRYSGTMGLTPEEALPRIQELNNNPAFINAGQELIIVPPNQGTAPEEVAAADAPAETPEAEEAAAEDATAEPVEEPTAVPVEEPAAVEEVAAAAAPNVAPGTVCVSAYTDSNADGIRNGDSEPLLANAAITLARGGNTLTTYVTDGISEPYCFVDLEADTYQVQAFAPADFQITTNQNWAIVVSDGVAIPIDFGAAEGVAEAEVTEGAETAVSAEAPVEETTNALAAEQGGFSLNFGTIIIGVAVLLILLAAVGVVMLRRG